MTTFHLDSNYLLIVATRCESTSNIEQIGEPPCRPCCKWWRNPTPHPLTPSPQDEGWWQGECNGAYGLFPANYVELLE